MGVIGRESFRLGERLIVLRGVIEFSFVVFVVFGVVIFFFFKIGVIMFGF